MADTTGDIQLARLDQVTKEQVGLDQVDNTSDVDKPVSTATQTAINEVHDSVSSLQGKVLSQGATTARPATSLVAGQFYFDTDLNKPIWYNGTSWVDATGTTV